MKISTPFWSGHDILSGFLKVRVIFQVELICRNSAYFFYPDLSGLEELKNNFFMAPAFNLPIGCGCWNISEFKWVHIDSTKNVFKTEVI